MKSLATLLAYLLAAFCWTTASASVFLPKTMAVKTTTTGSSGFSSSSCAALLDSRKDLRRALRQQGYSRRNYSSAKMTAAMAIPGYGLAEQVFVGGFGNFLSIYNLVITARILLSWFPQAQGIGLLQPVYAITDPYLNLFRGIIPPVFGLDLSPILAFILLNVLTSATAAVGYEIPSSSSTAKPAAAARVNNCRGNQQSSSLLSSKVLDKVLCRGRFSNNNKNQPCLNL